MASKVHIQSPPPAEFDNENQMLFVKVQATGDRNVLAVYARAYPASQSPPAGFDEDNDKLNQAATDVWEGHIGCPNGPFKVRARADFEGAGPMDLPIQEFDVSAECNRP